MKRAKKSVRDKVATYIRGRKTPFTEHDLVKRFGMSAGPRFREIRRLGHFDGNGEVEVFVLDINRGAYGRNSYLVTNVERYEV